MAPGILCAALLCVFLGACAEKPDGVIVLNEETVENFFEKDKQSWNPPAHLNLLLDQPVAEADIPAPRPGYVRLSGVLDSEGPYAFTGGGIQNRGGSYSDSVFGKLGPAGHAGNAWFYADYDPATGQIAAARAYLYGFMGGVCDMRKAVNGSYGLVTDAGFILSVMGPCLFPDVSGSTVDYALLAQGTRQNPPDGQNFRFGYIVDDSATLVDIPRDPRQSADVFDFGRGRATRE